MTHGAVRERCSGRGKKINVKRKTNMHVYWQLEPINNCVLILSKLACFESFSISVTKQKIRTTLALQPKSKMGPTQTPKEG